MKERSASLPSSTKDAQNWRLMELFGNIEGAGRIDRAVGSRGA